LAIAVLLNPTFRTRQSSIENWCCSSRFLAAYGRVDIALDTFPYHGTATTCEALWMGVPVITLAGDRHAARVGVSLLTAAGHPEWIAHDWEDYLARAVALAGDPQKLAEGRTGLREDLRRSPLLDHAGLVLNLQNLLGAPVEVGTERSLHRYVCS